MTAWNRRKRKADIRRDDRGASLFAVLVAVMFVAISGVIALCLAMGNYYMKLSGLRETDNFYSAEQALEEIRTGLQGAVGNAMSAAYITVLEDYDQSSDADVQNSTTTESDVRQKKFQTMYLDNLYTALHVADGKYALDSLKAYVTFPAADSEETLIVTNTDGSEPYIVKDDTEKCVRLKNLKVIYIDAKGDASIIETDIRLSTPSAQFPSPSTLPDLMNMIVVADGGLVCEGSATVSGSIYAGTLEDTAYTDRESILIAENGSLTISSGDKVVSSGRIEVGTGGGLSSADGVNLWAQGIGLAGNAKVTLSGTTYIADDLTVDGSGNTVKVDGSYYGFGSVDSAKESWNYTADTEKEADLSSAIVINGRNTTLDLSGAGNIMLAGQNYLSTSTVQNGAADILMGESLTVKGTQLAYLMPSELFSDAAKERGISGNPVSYTEYKTCVYGKDDLAGLGIFADNINKWINTTDTVSAWGGESSLSTIGVDAAEPVKAVFYNTGNQEEGCGQVYFYLNFTDASKAADFFQTCYGENKETLDKYLSFYLGDNSGIEVENETFYTRYVTGGNVLVKKDGEFSLNAASSDQDTAEEQTAYQNSWYALCRKMITSVDLLNTAVSYTYTDGTETHDERDPDRTVFDNLVNEKYLISYLEKNDRYYDFQTSDGKQAILYNNENITDGTLTIDSAAAENLRLVVCTGDVEIEANVAFQGIIMAKGKITLKDGASLTAEPLEAAQVFQAAVAAGGTGTGANPKDFFWEGDNYVLGSSTSTSGGSDTDTYEVSDSVSYENWKKR